MRLPREIGPIHFVGIGGIGMSGIAEVLCNLGYIVQGEFTADRLAAEISGLAAEPARLGTMAKAARSAGRLDAAERLADLVVKVAGI